MESALGDALQGRAPARDTESTWAMDDTEATRMMAGTSATTALPQRERPRRRMEPIEEAPPRRRRPEPAGGRERVSRRSAPAPARRDRGSGIKMWLGLLLVLALIAGGIALYQASQDTVQKGVQLKRDVQGQVQDAIDEVKGLIEDNTR